MNVKLFISALTKFALGVVLVGALIFLPAGSFAFLQGWLLMVALFAPMFVVGVILMIVNPDLLQKRLNAKEKEKDQNVVVKLSGLMFVVGFTLAGLGYRFGWFVLPIWVSIVATVLFLLAYGLYAEVLRENMYLSRTIEVHEGQRVIDTGLYGVVRHPMYSATLLLFLAMPLMLGSVYALLVFLIYPFVIAQRIKGEEALLEVELDGYSAYKKKVKFRLIPYIW